MSILITNIQRMCMHDGPGIRTTVFLKGCSICCPWCANPENISAKKQFYFDESKCKKADGICVYNQKCMKLENNETLISNAPENVKNICPIGAIGIFGQEITAKELFDEIIKDRIFWSNGGGVTFSGGEALLQIDELVQLMKLLKENNIHIAVETALFVSSASIKKALEYVDLFIVDVKILDKDICKNILNGNVEQYTDNIKLLAETDKKIIFRVPCSDEYTMTDKNRILLLDFFKEYRKYPIEIFKIHNLGQKKYRTLGMDIQGTILSEKISVFYNELLENGNKVSIISV